MTTQLSDFTLIVHIGPGKTGSSALQSAATQYFESLKKQNCFYLGVMFENSPIQLYPWQNSLDGPAHLTQKDIVSEKQLFKIIQSSIADLTEKNFTSAIWSNESTLRSGDMAIKVLNKIARMGVKVVTFSYLRNHEDLIKSSYIQWGIKLKRYKGPVKPFKEWITQQNILWYPKIEKWLNQKFTLVLKNYDAIEDVVLDFFQTNQLDLPEYINNRVNEKPNHTLLAMWAEFNSSDDVEKIEHDFKKIANPSGILEKQETIPNIFQLLPSSSDLTEITRQTEEDKEKINQLLGDNGFPPLTSPSLEKTKIDPFEQLWELHMYSLDMIYALQEQMFEHKINTRQQFQEMQKRITHNELTQSAFQLKIAKLLQEHNIDV